MLVIYLELVFMVLVWGFSFVVVHIASEFIPPLSIALYRFIIASIAFIIIDLYLKLKNKYIAYESKERIKFSKKNWIYIILASFTGVSFFFLAQYSAIQIIGPSLPALFVCLLAPVIITSLALIFFKEKLTLSKIIGFVLATIGGFLLITGGNLENLKPTSPNFLGYIFALITPFLWAFYTILAKKVSKDQSNMVMLKYIAYLGTFELLIFVLINNEFWIFVHNFFNIILFLCALYTGIICYVIGYFIWQNSQSKLKSSKVASFLYVEPFFTLLFSILFKRIETIVIWNIIGGVIVLIAVLIINYK